MEQHHRALSDAKAAAELLKLAFEKDDELTTASNLA
jgi:DNA polymerase-3 subunit epsilon